MTPQVVPRPSCPHRGMTPTEKLIAAALLYAKVLEDSEAPRWLQLEARERLKKEALNVTTENEGGEHGDDRCGRA